MSNDIGWICCDKCDKWRRVPRHVEKSVDENTKWTCRDNKNPSFNDCDAQQELPDDEIDAERNTLKKLGIISESESESEVELDDESESPNEETQDVAPDLISGDAKPTVTLIRRNIVHEKQLKLAIRQAHACHCTLPPEGPGCGPHCENRMICIECSPDLCPCGDRCSNQNFQKRQYKKLDVEQSGKKGFGLFAKEDIQKDSFIIEYVGEVLDEAGVASRMKHYLKIGQKHFYFAAIADGFVIDATYKGNLSRFLNHSCDPNCVLQKWTVADLSSLGLFAIKDIKGGEELTFNYQFSRFGGSKRLKCYCGAEKCRGWLEGSTADNKNEPAESESEEDMAKEESRDESGLKTEEQRPVMVEVNSEEEADNERKNKVLRKRFRREEKEKKKRSSKKQKTAFRGEKKGARKKPSPNEVKLDVIKIDDFDLKSIEERYKLDEERYSVFDDLDGSAGTKSAAENTAFDYMEVQKQFEMPRYLVQKFVYSGAIGKDEKSVNGYMELLEKGAEKILQNVAYFDPHLIDILPPVFNTDTEILEKIFFANNGIGLLQKITHSDLSFTAQHLLTDIVLVILHLGKKGLVSDWVLDRGFDADKPKKILAESVLNLRSRVKKENQHTELASALLSFASFFKIRDFVLCPEKKEPYWFSVRLSRQTPRKSPHRSREEPSQGVTPGAQGLRAEQHNQALPHGAPFAGSFGPAWPANAAVPLVSHQQAFQGSLPGGFPMQLNQLPAVSLYQTTHFLPPGSAPYLPGNSHFQLAPPLAMQPNLALANNWMTPGALPAAALPPPPPSGISSEPGQNLNPPAVKTSLQGKDRSEKSKESMASKQKAVDKASGSAGKEDGKEAKFWKGPLEEGFREMVEIRVRKYVERLAKNMKLDSTTQSFCCVKLTETIMKREVETHTAAEKPGLKRKPMKENDVVDRVKRCVYRYMERFKKGDKSKKVKAET